MEMLNKMGLAGWSCSALSHRRENSSGKGAIIGADKKMNTIAEFAALHGFVVHRIYQYISRHKVPTIRESRLVVGNYGVAYTRTVALLPEESERLILENYKQKKHPGPTIRHSQPKVPIISEFERYLVGNYMRLRGKATAEQIVTGCLETFREGV